MPNRPRSPYRSRLPDVNDPHAMQMQSADDRCYELLGLTPPSTVHSSDPEETVENKYSFLKAHTIACTVLLRWKFFIWRKKRRRTRSAIIVAFRKHFSHAIAYSIAHFAPCSLVGMHTPFTRPYANWSKHGTMVEEEATCPGCQWPIQHGYCAHCQVCGVLHCRFCIVIWQPRRKCYRCGLQGPDPDIRSRT